MGSSISWGLLCQARFGWTCILAAWLSPCLGQDSAPLQGFVSIYGGSRDGMNLNDPSYTLVSGACGYGEFDRSAWPYWRAVGLGFQNPLSMRPVPKNGCGTCLEITCTGYGCASNATSVTVLVADTCQNCTADQITMHASTFQQFMAPQSQGTVNATYRQVDCDPPGNMIVRVSSIIPAYNYMRLAILERQLEVELLSSAQVAGSGILTSVSILANGSEDFTPMANQWGSTWQASDLDTNPPFSLQVTDIINETIVLRDVIGSFAEGDYPSDMQFMAPDQAGMPTQAPQPQQSPAPAPQSGTAGMSLALDPGTTMRRPGLLNAAQGIVDPGISIEPAAGIAG